jgi:lipid II:glycine glycyltransferase (peptidoglycan interpeptide bridge formation enzyme)
VNVYAFDPLTDHRWPTFVDEHPSASVFHTPEWLEALRRTYGYLPVAYTTSCPGDRLRHATVLCEIRSWLTGRRLVSLPFADHCQPLVDHPADRDAIAAHLRHAVDSGAWKYVESRPLTSDPADPRGPGPAGAFCFHSLDLDPALEVLFENCHKDSIQRKIRRAERESLRCDTGTSDEHLRTLYALVLLTRRRHHLPPQPRGWFGNLRDCMGDRFRICVASKDGRAVAAVVLLRHRDTLVYKYGASDVRFHNLGAMPFLFWNAICDAKAAGIRRLDLGRSDANNDGLITFKDRLGADRSTLTYVRYPVPSDAQADAYPQVDMAKRMLARLPDRLLAATGSVLYRHVG